MSNSEHGHGHGHGGEGASAESVAAGYEVSDWQARPVIVLTIATFAILILTFILIAGLALVTGGGVGDTSNTLAPTDAAQAQLPPGPRLEQNPNADSERMLAAASERLETAGWADQAAGTAHIPLERAKELLLERGINPFEGAQTGAGGGAAAGPTTAPAAGGAPVEFDAALAAQGEQLFASIGCASCHRDDGAGLGPSLVGVYNREETLVDGSAVADEAYLIESILNPTAKVVEGYNPVMPPYQGQLSDDQVAQLVEYIRSLAE